MTGFQDCGVSIRVEVFIRNQSAQEKFLSGKDDMCNFLDRVDGLMVLLLGTLSARNCSLASAEALRPVPTSAVLPSDLMTDSADTGSDSRNNCDRNN